MSKHISRARSRKYLFQKLYALSFNWDLQKTSFEESFFEWKFKVWVDEKYISEMQMLIVKKEKVLLGLIKKYAPKFDVENMNIENTLPMMIALTEMFFLDEEVPAKVSINEAVELAKIYSWDSSKRIVNWVLNKIFQDHESISKSLDSFTHEWDFSFFESLELEKEWNTI